MRQQQTTETTATEQKQQKCLQNLLKFHGSTKEINIHFNMILNYTPDRQFSLMIVNY